MTVLRGKPTRLQISNSPAEQSKDQPAESLATLLARLEEEVKLGKITPTELMARLRAWHDAHPQNAAEGTPRVQPSGLNAPPAPAGDRITAGGDIGHGSNMGGGTLTQRDVIGRDQISNTAQQITHVNIEHVGQMTLPGSVAKVSPNGSQPGIGEHGLLS